MWTINKGEIKMENNTLKQAQADIEAMDMLKDGLIEETNNDTTRDIAIRCTDRLVKGGIIKDCTDTNDDTEFRVQDIIHEEINKMLTCPTCDQYPYSDTDDMCPVCGQSIKEK